MKTLHILGYGFVVCWLLGSFSACAQHNNSLNGNSDYRNDVEAADEKINKTKLSEKAEDRLREEEIKKKGQADHKAGTTTTTTATGGTVPQNATTTTLAPDAAKDKMQAKDSPLRIEKQDQGLFFSIEILADQAPAAPSFDPINNSNFGLEYEENTKVREDLPPMRFVRVKISIQNRQPHPMWYLLPSQGEVELQGDGRFEAAAPATAFSGREYTGMMNGDSSQTGRLVECHFRGNYQHGFKAFYLPPQTSITLRNYPLEVWGDLTEIELWGVKSLLVNGAKPLQDWLPYSALADSGNLRINCPEDGNCACREMEEHTKLCTESVNFMLASDFKKYHLVLP